MVNKETSPQKIVCLLLTTVVLVFGDQLLKLWVIKKGGFFIIRDFLDIGFYKNYGIAFGIPLPYYILFPLVAAALILIIGRYWKKLAQGNNWVWLACLLIVGGALSNMFDRLYWGYVVDFIHFSFGSTFNVADVMIVAGVVVLLGVELRRRKS